MKKTAMHPLQAWREAEGVSRPALARAIGVQPHSVRRYEQGRMPQQPFLDRIVLLTKGAVSANDWLGPEAAEMVARHTAGGAR